MEADAVLGWFSHQDVGRSATLKFRRTGKYKREHIKYQGEDARHTPKSAIGPYQSFIGSGYAAVQLHQTSRSLHLRKRHKNEDRWKYLGPEPETGIVAEKGWLKQTGHIQLKRKPFRAILQCGHVCRRLRKTRAMDQLNQILADATAAISAPYFHLPIFGGPPVWRERVYCYELYHQMRLRWPEGCPLILTGEVDKRAHPIFEELEARQAIPDLLVHSPGHMDQNFAVMEIKSQQAQPQGVQKDMATLRAFCDTIGYRRALYLVFGPELPAALGELPADIEVWHHHEVGTPARILDRA